jgi:hypothetical protein
MLAAQSRVIPLNSSDAYFLTGFGKGWRGNI